MMKEDAQITQDVSQIAIDSLSADLMMEGVMIREEMNLKWVCEDGLVEKIDEIVLEFKKSRCLLPIRINLLGPPGVGKTEIAKQLR